MAQTRKSVSEFIQDAFCPMVAVLCSYDAESICRKNNLAFAELIQPFCRLPVEVSYRDPSNNNLVIVKNFRLDIKDFNSLPPQSTTTKKILNESVSNALNSVGSIYERTIESEQYQFRIRATTPWFDAWRDTFLRFYPGGDHEFLKNYLSCIMVVSTSHLDPMDAFAKLVEQQARQQQQTPSRSPKWFMNNNIYKYFLLLHDVTEGEESRAVSIFADLKQQYGAGNCHLLQINSKRATQVNTETDGIINMPDPWRLHVKHSSQNVAVQRDASINDSISALTEMIDQELGLTSSISHPLSLSENSTSDFGTVSTDEGIDGSSVKSSVNVIHGACLTTSDHDRIHVFMNEYVVKGLLPWVENNLKFFNEQITSRKGLTRIFSVSRRLLGGNTTPSKTQSSSSLSTNLGNETTEVILRRAADLAFLFQNYDFAHNCYNAARRDSTREQGPAFHAGVLEMCCLSNFMQDTGAGKSYQVQYMEEAIETYLLAAKLPFSATRAVLMSVEILKSRESHDQAVLQFLKLSHEDTELRSALFLEQASLCFLNYRPPSIRKYAFHMVIAGHRFLKNGQRLHALRCYNDVLSIYAKPNWSLALDHINFTLGRQSALTNHTNDAIASFHALFGPTNRMQSDQQQINFFKEYLTFFNKLNWNQSCLPELPIPIVENTTIKVLLSGPQTARFDGQVSNCNGFDFDETRDIWSDLERTMTAHDRHGTGTRSQKNLFTNRTNNSLNPIAVANETIRVEFYLRNTLQVPLLLSEVALLWKYSSSNKGKQQSGNISHDSAEENQEFTNDSTTLDAELPVESQAMSDCIIFPNDNYKVELSCRPLRSGFVTLLGVRYRLNILVQNISDQTTWPYGVLGKTLFQVRGPRLNSNHKERLNVMYAVDRRLEIQVIPETPLLQVEFSPVSTEMFCGEIQSCLVHLVNTSSAHSINRVRLTTSQASLIAVTSLDDSHIVKETDQSKSHWNPTFHSHNTSLQLVSHHHVLAEKSTHTIRLWIKAPQTPGELNIDFLFIYDSDQCQQPLRHRTVKHSSFFVISQSFNFNTECQQIGLDELLFPVQVDNLISTTYPQTVEIKQLSSISKQWDVENLSSFTQNSMKSGENLSLLFKCQRRSMSNEHLLIKNFLLSKEIENKITYLNVTENPVGDFFRHFVVPNVPSTNTHRNKTPIQITPPQISFLLLWKIETDDPSGERNIRHGLHFLAPKIDIVPSETQDNDDTIKYDLVYPSVVEHKFPRMLDIPVELKLFNGSNEKVDIQLQLSRSSLNIDSYPPLHCLWCGVTEKYVQLPAHEHLSIPLKACFFKAGLYSLGNIILNRTNQEKQHSIPIKANNHHYFIDIRASS